MLTNLAVFAVLALIAIGYSRLANRLNIVDHPNFRSSHTSPTIRGGGVLFFIAVVLFFFLSDYQYPFFLLGLTILSVISFTDDLLTLKASTRLPFQFIGIFFILYSLYPDPGSLPYWYFILFPVIAVGFVNIYNFMDGINGITGMYSLAVLQGFWILNEHVTSVINDNLIIITGISLVIFGYFNFRQKAKFFAGDVGSISLAGIIVFIGIKFIIATQSPLILALVAVYGIDAGLTIIRRALKTDNIFQAHRQHLYQHLVDKAKFSHLKVAAGYAMLQLVINLIVLFAFSASLENQYLIFFLLLGTLTLIYFALLFWSRKKEHPQFAFEKN